MDILILFTVFGILFLGELGDKTQLIVFNLTLEHHKPYKVGIGAMIGFAIIVTLGVFFGAVITNFIPISLITLISGIVFVIIGLLDIRNARSLLNERRKKNFDEDISSNIALDNQTEEIKVKRFSKLRNNPILAGFGFIFLMELGDKTQILTITLASIYPNLIEVWIGSFLALSSLAWLGVFFGAFIAKKIPKLYLKLVSITIFIVIGIFTIVSVF